MFEIKFKKKIFPFQPWQISIVGTLYCMEERGRTLHIQFYYTYNKTVCKVRPLSSIHALSLLGQHS